MTSIIYIELTKGLLTQPYGINAHSQLLPNLMICHLSLAEFRSWNLLIGVLSTWIQVSLPRTVVHNYPTSGDFLQRTARPKDNTLIFRHRLDLVRGHQLHSSHLISHYCKVGS